MLSAVFGKGAAGAWGFVPAARSPQAASDRAMSALDTATSESEAAFQQWSTAARGASMVRSRAWSKAWDTNGSVIEKSFLEKVGLEKSAWKWLVRKSLDRISWRL
jgi:kynurenine formamidase